ncbi:ABC transporter ATP-binding protein [Puniceibacterium sp. HSS470]|jgi:sulfonate transport system ATP-binding protein|nr:ABC transporter ATP-binding protein [Puniceibacterium sp. HSS470]|tara:strand:+ start:59000 stop:59605 length:606 start_codon:yes stop_codon:yes gene_type:complete
MTPVLSVDITEKSFAGAVVLGPMSLAIGRGETVAVLGQSGIGKTTLLRIVAGIDTAFTGAVARPARVAMVFQAPTLLPWRSVAQNISLVVPGLTTDAVEQALEKVGLGGRGAAFPGQLSLGQQRRLALARAFAGRPDLLILDEPFVSLDAETAEAMVALTEALLAEVRPATLLVTHAPAEARRLADRVMMLAGRPAGLSPC